MRQILAVLWILVAGAAPAAAQQTAAQFERANLAYLQGHWSEAAEGYRALTSAGVDDAAVWFNLGNACARVGDLGRARVSYERALLRAPRDADVRFNLALLRTRLAESDGPEGIAAAAGWLTADELTVATSVAWLSLWGSLALWLRQRGASRGGGVAAAALALALSGGLLAVRVAARPAVILTPEARLHAGPGRDYAKGIALHTGARVAVLRDEGDWRLVREAHDRSGWIRAVEMEEVAPAPGAARVNEMGSAP